MTAQIPTLIDKYTEIFEANLKGSEDILKKQGRRLSKKSFMWWSIIQFRQLLQRYGEEITTYAK